LSATHGRDVRPVTSVKSRTVPREAVASLRSLGIEGAGLENGTRFASELIGALS